MSIYGGHYRLTPFSIELDKDDLKNLRDALEEVENPYRGTATAINDMAKYMQDKLSEKTVKVYRFRGGKSEIKRCSFIRKATVGFARATIEFHSTVKEPRDFYLSEGMVERVKKNGAKYKSNRIKDKFIMSGNRAKGVVRGAILKSESPQVLKGETGNAFIVQFKSSHIAVVTRDPKEVAKKYAGQKYNKHTAKLRAWQSPSPSKMVHDEKVYGSLETEFAEKLHEMTGNAIEKRLDRFGGR